MVYLVLLRMVQSMHCSSMDCRRHRMRSHCCVCLELACDGLFGSASNGSEYALFEYGLSSSSYAEPLLCLFGISMRWFIWFCFEWFRVCIVRVWIVVVIVC